MAASSLCVPRVSCSCFLPLQEILQIQQVGLTEAPFKSLLLPWVPEHVRCWVHPFRVESQFLTAPGSPERKPCWPSKQNVLRAYLPSSGPQARKSTVLRPLASCGESLQL